MRLFLYHLTYNVLYENYYSIETEDQYLFQTQSQTKVTRITLPEVHGMKNTLDMSILPEKQKPQIHSEQVDKNKPRLGRGRAGMKCKKPQPVAEKTVSASKSHNLSTVQNVTKGSMAFPVPKQLITNETETNTRREILSKNREQPFYPDLIYRSFPRPPENL